MANGERINSRRADQLDQAALGDGKAGGLLHAGPLAIGVKVPRISPARLLAAGRSRRQPHQKPADRIDGLHRAGARRLPESSAVRRMTARRASCLIEGGPFRGKSSLRTGGIETLPPHVATTARGAESPPASLRFEAASNGPRALLRLSRCRFRRSLDRQFRVRRLPLEKHSLDAGEWLGQSLIRSDSSSNRLRRSARCAVCGHKGAMTMHPGVAGQLISPFPADRG